MLEGKIFPPNSSVISKPERKGATFNQIEPIITTANTATINGIRHLDCPHLFISINSFI
ncbi:hypothetical protein BACSTE_01773 [Bacteroides stercoris ATCC 43183]|uniref:Uncharacterized protein n=1 Tax=Bacteroides stercoris ATCC 43183 TaxID=449673 RepID=B0NQX2_BACSE|nr:hypothetical protein BACSTE_01773 [Bacteroides stercoris ATCC 43183]